MQHCVLLNPLRTHITLQKQTNDNIVFHLYGTTLTKHQIIRPKSEWNQNNSIGGIIDIQIYRYNEQPPNTTLG